MSDRKLCAHPGCHNYRWNLTFVSAYCARHTPDEEWDRSLAEVCEVEMLSLDTYEAGRDEEQRGDKIEEAVNAERRRKEEMGL